MIRTFRHKGLRAFYETGSKAGILPSHGPRLLRQLVRLESAIEPEDMNVKGWAFHRLSGPLAGHFSVSVSGHWRLTFAFEDGNAVMVDYQDHH